MTSPIAKATPSPRFLRFFGGYAQRLLRKHFAHVRLERQSDAALRSAAAHEGPLLIAMNHPSWWDPIVGVALRHAYFPGRPGLSPIEMPMFDRFRFMRKLGLFGIDPAHPEALRAMVSYIRAECNHEPRTAVFITPQGALTDPREPILVRPGIASLATALPSARVLCVLAELTFWHDKRPELMLLVRPCPAPETPTTAAWTRAVRAEMQSGADELARLAIARDEAAFVPMLAPKGSAVNPAYDLWQRLRGRSARIDPARRGARA